MKIIKNQVSLSYYVKGKGFAGTQASATRLTETEANAVVASAKDMGLIVSVECINSDPNIIQNANGKSFAVSFIRPKDLNSDGSIKTHKRNPSKRRFRTIEEARHHGGRYVVIEKHLGYYVTETNDPVNAYVNQVTGFTNPEVGKKRLAR